METIVSLIMETIVYLPRPVGSCDAGKRAKVCHKSMLDVEHICDIDATPTILPLLWCCMGKRPADLIRASDERPAMSDDAGCMRSAVRSDRPLCQSMGCASLSMAAHRRSGPLRGPGRGSPRTRCSSLCTVGCTASTPGPGRSRVRVRVRVRVRFQSQRHGFEGHRLQQ